MSGELLRRVPSPADLERLYHELALLGAPASGKRRPWPYRLRNAEELLALAGDMLRYDPRLLTILLHAVVRRWQDLNPLELRRQMAKMRWPQSLAVALSFARLATRDPEARAFIDYACSRWPRVDPPERFFFAIDRAGSRTAARKLGRNLGPYARWGFIGTERPIADLRTRRAVGSYDSRTRRDILAGLFEDRGSVTVGEYLHALDHAITRQQALNDLRSFPGARLVGRGRGAHWSSVRRGA